MRKLSDVELDLLREGVVSGDMLVTIPQTRGERHKINYMLDLVYDGYMEPKHGLLGRQSFHITPWGRLALERAENSIL